MKQLATTHLRDLSKWLRLAYLLLYSFIFYFIVMYLVFLIAIFQLAHTLITGKPNANLSKFNQGFCQYILDICRYMTYASDHKPFPFDKWPS